MNWWDMLKQTRQTQFNVGSTTAPATSGTSAEKPTNPKTHQQRLGLWDTGENLEQSNLEAQNKPHAEEIELTPEQQAEQQAIKDKEGREKASQNPNQTKLFNEGVQEPQTTQTQTDDSGTDAGSDVFNTSEKVQEYKTRMMRPARGNKANEVAQIVDKVTEAFVDVTNRNKLLREVWELAGKAKV